MKKLLLSSTILLLFTTIVQAQSSDYTLIEKTLNYYLEGGTNNDFETLEKAFHPDATMKWITGEYNAVNAVEFFKSRMKPGPPQDRETRITSITVTGTVANARLEIEYDTFMFVDHMNLLKIDGEWKVVGKIFTRINL